MTKRGVNSIIIQKEENNYPDNFLWQLNLPPPNGGWCGFNSFCNYFGKNMSIATAIEYIDKEKNLMRTMLTREEVKKRILKKESMNREIIGTIFFFLVIFFFIS